MVRPPRRAGELLLEFSGPASRHWKNGHRIMYEGLLSHRLKCCRILAEYKLSGGHYKYTLTGRQRLFIIQRRVGGPSGPVLVQTKRSCSSESLFAFKLHLFKFNFIHSF